MRKLLIRLLTLGSVAVLLQGCLLVPVDDYHHHRGGYYEQGGGYHGGYGHRDCDRCR